ncbi:glycoside hydrolase family 5 protein [Pseudocnuella soli]|uniref:glycoside hydrolase family 5 protein n=1 Tax=Pseudocnuella soli TaxID=2502779 RepID=UPI0010522C7E|nr:glycoside hydrolase family 5 protein [Pseudocnuella soli]
MKTVYSLFLACMVAICLPARAQNVVRQHGQLQVKGTKLCNQKGEPVVLRGMSFGWHNFWPRFYNRGAVQWLQQDWGCTVVRAAMGVEPRRGYKQDSAGSVRAVKAVVEAAIAAGIYVIIDWHSHNINLEEARTFFAQMAQEYGQYPNVIYEIFNEPERQSWDEVKAYSAEVIRTIRKWDPDNIILVGSPYWDQDVHLAADAPLKGFSNLMYTLHYYAATHKQALRDRGTYALKKGLPLFISESAGMEATGNGPLNESEWLQWIEWAEQNGVSWVTWSVSDKDETCSVLQPTAASDGGWKEMDLKESGKKARALIRKYNKVYLK